MAHLIEGMVHRILVPALVLVRKGWSLRRFVGPIRYIQRNASRCYRHPELLLGTRPGLFLLNEKKILR